MTNIDVTFKEFPDKVYEVRVSPISFGDFFEMQALLKKWAEDPIALTDRFAEIALVALPSGKEPTGAHLREEDMNVVIALIHEWAGGVAEAPLPLRQPSSGGGPSKAPRASRSRRS